MIVLDNFDICLDKESGKRVKYCVGAIQKQLYKMKILYNLGKDFSDK